MMFTQARAEKKIAVLSGGEKSRVVLAKILASPCHLLLLDEPTNHLDIESMEAFIDALEEFEGAVAIVTHSELVLDRLAERLVVFAEGKQELFLGTYGDFLQKGGWQEEKEDEEKTPIKREQSFKETKRLRAELVTERAKLLKPYLTKIEQLEAKIISLEADLEALNQALVEAVQTNKSFLIADHSKSIKERQKEVELLFTQLEESHTTAEAIRREYEHKFNALD